MKLIQFSKITDAYLTDKLLILNASALSTHYVARLISRDSTSVATKGGITLPPELWDRIIKLSPRRAPRDTFDLVEAKMTSETETEKVLTCQGVKLKVGFGLQIDDYIMLEKCEELLRFRSRVERFSLYDYCSDYESEDELLEVEQCEFGLWDGELSEDGLLDDKLSKDKLPEDKLPENKLPENKLVGNANPVKTRSPGVVHLDTTYQVVIRADGSGHPCIFADLTVPDVIARVEGGQCSFCDGDRFISPCCMEGRASDFGLELMCGAIVCPLCVGMDIASDHEEFLDEWDYHGPKAEKMMNMYISKRFRELGYKRKKSVEGCCD